MNSPLFVLAQVNPNNLAGTLELAVLIGLLVPAIAGLVVLAAALFPGLTHRTRQNVEQMPVRSFLVGLVNFIFFGFIGLALSAAGLSLLGLIILILLGGLYALGLAGLALLVGERLRPGNVSPVRQILAGSVTLELAAIVPFVGWFGVPVLSLVGLGGLIIAIATRPRRSTPPPMPPGPPGFPPGNDFYNPYGVPQSPQNPPAPRDTQGPQGGNR